MEDNVIINHTLEEYNKKYHNRNYRLLKISKKEIAAFDKKHPTKIKNFLLKGRKWWLIGDTYYEVPKAPSFLWFRNLHAAVQITVCLLLGGAISAAVSVPIFTSYLNNLNESVIVDPKSSSNVDIKDIIVKENGDKQINVAKKESATLVNKIIVKKGNDVLKINEEYIITKQSNENKEETYDKFSITIFKAALDAHFGQLSIITEHQKQIVVNHNKINLQLGEKLHLTATVDNAPILVSWDLVGETQCLDIPSAFGAECDVTAILAGNAVLRAHKTNYAEALIPVIVTADKEIIITPSSVEPMEIADELTFSAELSTHESVDFEFNLLGSALEIVSKTSNTVKVRAIKSGLSVLSTSYGYYRKNITIEVNPIVISGDHNINIDSFTHTFVADITDVKWSLKDIDNNIASINEDTGELTVNESNISKAVSGYVVAKKLNEEQEFPIEIASFDKVVCEYDREKGNYLLESSEESGSKTASGILILPSRYYDADLGFKSVVGFKEEAFMGTSITSVAIPNSFTSIASSSFKNCTLLTSLNIPQTVSYIGKEIIDGCSGITGVTFDAKYPWIIKENDETQFHGYLPSDDAATNLTTLNTYKECTWSLSDFSISGSEEVELGESIELSASSAISEVTWSTSDSNVATVDSSGVVTGQSEGDAFIFASGLFEESKKVMGIKKITVVNNPYQIIGSHNDMYGRGARLNLKVNKDKTNTTWESDSSLVNIDDGYITISDNLDTTTDVLITATSPTHGKAYFPITVFAQATPTLFSKEEFINEYTNKASKAFQEETSEYTTSDVTIKGTSDTLSSITYSTSEEIRNVDFTFSSLGTFSFGGGIFEASNLDKENGLIAKLNEYATTQSHCSIYYYVNDIGTSDLTSYMIKLIDISIGDTLFSIRFNKKGYVTNIYNKISNLSPLDKPIITGNILVKYAS